MFQTLEEAEKRRIELVKIINKIQLDLGNPDRRDKDGNRLSPRDYFQWRQRAKYNLHQVEAELFEVKAYIKKHRDTLLKDSVAKILSVLPKHRITLDTDEKEAVCNLLQFVGRGEGENDLQKLSW